MYDTNNKLRFVTTHSEHDARSYCDPATNNNGKDSIFIAGVAYRYDALGRRVWMQSRAATFYDGPQSATHCCDRTLTQQWDGEELLAESQAVPTKGWGSNGTVVYTSGGGIDRPISIARRYGTCGGFTLYTKLSWRGLLDQGGSTPATFTCGEIGAGGGGLYWPEQDYGASGVGRSYDPSSGWNGSILSPGQDETGLSYKRNRYYDSKTGQFSQEDPIGLAGGLNTYGFANGDPVTYSDPFGLAACKYYEVECLSDELTAWGGGTGATGKVLVPSVLTAVSFFGLDGAENDAAGAANGSKLSAVSLGASFVFAAVPGGSGARKAENLVEQMAMDAAKSGFGREIMEGKIKDVTKAGMMKMEVVVTNKNDKALAIVHYWKDRATGELSGFKFKPE